MRLEQLMNEIAFVAAIVKVPKGKPGYIKRAPFSKHLDITSNYKRETFWYAYA